jgi:hypothetical protein
MSELTEFIRWCKKERVTLRRALDMMESGVVHTGESALARPNEIRRVNR